jgi:hypothetical protein
LDPVDDGIFDSMVGVGSCNVTKFAPVLFVPVGEARWVAARARRFVAFITGVR